MIELTRILRHGIAPLTAWLVAKGYMPEFMQSDVTELLVLLTAFAVPYAFSWMRDRKRSDV